VGIAIEVPRGSGQPLGKLGIGQENYYLEKVAEGAEDYYSGEGEEAGQWIGDAAEELGLEGEVSADQLKAMLTGKNPVDGEALLGQSGVPATVGHLKGASSRANASAPDTQTAERSASWPGRTGESALQLARVLRRFSRSRITAATGL